MFRTSQIVTGTELLKHFKVIADELSRSDEPLLVMQRSGKHLALMSAEFFEELLLRTAPPGADAGIKAGVRERIQAQKAGV